MFEEQNNYIEDSESQDIQEPKVYSLKILFGPMFGCELTLPAEDYFILIKHGNELANQNLDYDHAAYFTKNALYIPCDEPSPNILLYLLSSPSDKQQISEDPESDNDGTQEENSDNESSPEYEADSIEQLTENSHYLDIYDTSGIYRSTIEENKIFVYEHIIFAIKKEEDEWHEDILNFGTIKDQLAETSIFHKKKVIYIITIILFLIVLAAVIWGYWGDDTDKKVQDLNNLFSNVPFPIKIVKGRKNHDIYVITQNDKDLFKVGMILSKLSDSQQRNVIPLVGYQQTKAITDKLYRDGYPVLQVDLTAPEHPIVYVFHNLNEQQKEDITLSSLNYLPYVQSINFQSVNPDKLLMDAQDILDRFYIRYKIVRNTNGYTLYVHDNLNDNTLFELNKSITRFYSEWGDRVINFSVNLDEDWLRNKSYLDAPNHGYLFVNPQHWYFPINKGDI